MPRERLCTIERVGTGPAYDDMGMESGDRHSIIVDGSDVEVYVIDTDMGTEVSVIWCGGLDFMGTFEEFKARYPDVANELFM